MPKRSRSSHVSKTPSERSAYQRYIRQIESQPTIEEPTELDPSFEARQEFAEPTSRRERTLPLSLRIHDHLEKNWISWAFGLLIGIAIFLLYDVRVNLAILNHDLSTQQQELDSTSKSLEKVNDTNHAQDLIIQELRIRLENIIDKIAISPAESIPPEGP